MAKLKPTVLTLIFLLIALNPALSSDTAVFEKPPVVSDYLKVFSPERIQQKTSINIYKNLEFRHLKSMKIDDNFSSGFLDKYLGNLDSSKMHFTAEDIKKFEKERYHFDNYIARGNLNPAYKIFNLYQERVVERLVYMSNRLLCCLDTYTLTEDDSFETDREKKPWPGDKKELRALWEKRLKNDILSLKLSDKKTEGIKETLSNRYKYQLKRAAQLEGEDVFEIYMNSITGLFDPHTQYLSPRDSEDFDIHMSLSLEGIGALLHSEEDFTKVLRLVPAGPADKSKLLKAGDRIIGVGQGPDGKIVDVVGWRINDVVQLIRGPKNTVVRLNIIPATAPDSNHTTTINITRNTVKLEEQAAQKKLIELEHEGRKFKIGVITIPAFYFDFKAYHAHKKDFKSTTRDVKNLLAELKAENIDGIIIDLRENGGGALDEAVSLTGLFIRQGPAVIVKNYKNERDVQYDQDPEIVYDGPLAVVVNRLSASASEIFAGAIKDYRRGIILGTRTFGKGSVQTLVDLNQGKLKLTFAKFYRILGESTQHRGVIPDISFPSLYNFEDIGESSLDEALPWDTTRPAIFSPFMDIDMKQVVSGLSEMHQKRISTSAEYKYLVDYNKYFRKLQKKTSVSLNEAKRKAELEDSRGQILKIENNLRISKSEKPYPDYDSYKKALEEKEADKNIGETRDKDKDFVLTESERIMADYINLLKKNGL